MQRKMEEPEEGKEREEEESAGAVAEPGESDSPGNGGQEQGGRLNAFLRRAARTLLIAALLFAAGLLTSLVAFQRPKVSELNARVDDLSAEVSDLESQVADLEAENDELAPLEDENRVLRVSLAEADLHVRVLSALKDVQSAQLSLALGQVDEARLNLSRTEDRLRELGEMLPADQQGVVDGMVQRLTLVLEGMDVDAFAAQSDLEVLANSLVQLENTLFVTP